MKTFKEFLKKALKWTVAFGYMLLGILFLRWMITMAIIVTALVIGVAIEAVIAFAGTTLGVVVIAAAVAYAIAALVGFVTLTVDARRITKELEIKADAELSEAMKDPEAVVAGVKKQMGNADDLSMEEMLAACLLLQKIAHQDQYKFHYWMTVLKMNWTAAWRWGKVAKRKVHAFAFDL